jgi:hypothetical protein
MEKTVSYLRPFVFVMLENAPSTHTAMQISRTCHLDSPLLQIAGHM